MRSFTGIVVLVMIAASVQAQPRDPLLTRFEGDWGLPGSDFTCKNVEGTLTFASDGSELEIRYPVPMEYDEGQFSDVFEYSVLAIAGNSVRMKLKGETRRDERGELVIWDLVLRSPDAYCWHRADWEPDQCTPLRFRCDSEIDRFERETSRVAGSTLELFQNRRFSSAAARFSLPEAIPKNEHEAEYRRLENSLRLLINELGEPFRWELVEQGLEELPEIVSISIGPSHVLVSQEHGTYFYALYEVEYRREEKGYFRAAFYRTGGIAQMTFSLPRAKSERIAEIGELILRETAHEF